MASVELTQENFKNEVLDSPLPILVDFWAPWCGPCKSIAPVVDEIAKEYMGKLKVGKVNVDQQQQIAMQYGIRSIPTLLIFKNGAVVDQFVGAVPKSTLVEKISRHFN
ncbi:MAG TPA: thioredoxin [Bacteroidota bacterium]|nr:thioredoxin [Bacteroidota bacterium]